MQSMMAERQVPYACSEKAKTVFGWLDWIVEGELPLNFYENRLARKYGRLDPIAKATLKKYLATLTDLVEGEISRKIPSKYALIFDGWSVNSDHFVAVFVSYSKEGRATKHLLSFAPLPDETNQSALNHKDFIIRTLEYLRFDPCGEVCLVGDNCSTNVATARLLGVPLLGCASHRLNLAAERVLKKYETELDLIAGVMRKLSTTNPAGHLRKLTPLKPIRRNDSRWSSAFDMVDRFLDIAGFARTVMRQIKDPVVMPSAAQVTRLKAIRQHELSILQSVSMALQQEGTTVADVRDIFDDVVAELPETAHHLGPAATIIKHAAFENAVTKIQRGRGGQLTAAELGAAQNLVEDNEGEEGGVETDSSISFAERALKRRRLAEQKERRFIDISFLEPTSNLAERLFSTAKRLFNDKIKSMLPQTLEQLLFLRANRDMWGLAEVATVADQIDRV
ncbi:hypothetical protein BBJ28_00007144 [Nothophytophthora sp. Chile5]|nr:hypothetical protein BBJ28_00007144 [Nothophytophthora sp. Chile5]